MKTYARIENDVVVELFETDGDITGIFHPAMVWVECDASVQQRWAYDGSRFSKPEPLIYPSYVPQSVTRRQGRLALLDVDKLDAVEAAIEAIPDPVQKRKAQIEYETDTWERTNQFLQSMWAQQGGTESELDALFIAGSFR